MKGKAPRKHSLHEKTAASVLLKLFISSNERCKSCENPTFTLSKPNTLEHPPDKERDERFVLEGSDGVLGCLDDEVPCELGDGRDETRRRH